MTGGQPHVGAEECCVLAILLDPLGSSLEDVLLCTCDSDIGCRVRSGDIDEIHAKLVAGLDHDCPSSLHLLHCEVAREGDVDECVASELVSSIDHQVATGNEVIGCGEISSAGDEVGLLMGLASEAEDVRADSLDLAESLSCSRNSLVDDDSLHERIVSKAGDDGDRCLLLFHEVIRIGHVLDVSAVCDCTILCDESLSTAQVILRLGYCTCYDTDMERCICKNSRGQHCENHKSCKEFLHCALPLISMV